MPIPTHLRAVMCVEKEAPWRWVVSEEDVLLEPSGLSLPHTYPTLTIPIPTLSLPCTLVSPWKCFLWLWLCCEQLSTVLVPRISIRLGTEAAHTSWSICHVTVFSLTVVPSSPFYLSFSAGCEHMVLPLPLKFLDYKCTPSLSSAEDQTQSSVYVGQALNRPATPLTSQTSLAHRKLNFHCSSLVLDIIWPKLVIWEDEENVSIRWHRGKPLGHFLN